MIAKWTPSSMHSTAAFAAWRAALIRPSACIDPDASTMMISVAPEVRRPPSPPDDVTVTIAFTSVAPSARNSFWKASAVYGIPTPSGKLRVDGNRLDGNQGHGDVVRTAGRVGQLGERTGRVHQR